MAAEISFKNIKRHDVQKIGMSYINHLVENGEYDSAARWASISFSWSTELDFHTHLIVCN